MNSLILCNQIFLRKNSNLEVFVKEEVFSRSLFFVENINEKCDYNEFGEFFFSLLVVNKFELIVDSQMLQATMTNTHWQRNKSPERLIRTLRVVGYSISDTLVS